MGESNFDSMAAFAMGMDSGRNCGGYMGGYGMGGYGMGGGMNDWMGLGMFALIFGRNGLFNNNNEGNCATQADVRAAVDQQTLISKIDQQTYGISDLGYALTNNLNNNFRGIDNAVCTLGFQTQQGFGNLSAQLSGCCCDIERGIDRNTTQGVMNTNAIQQQISNCCCDLEKMNMQNRFDAQGYNCSTLQAIDKLGDRIIGFMSDEKMQALRDENQALRLAASQARQNRELVDELRPYPRPAYITCNPYAASWGNSWGGRDGGWNWGRNSDGCGCGNCC